MKPTMDGEGARARPPAGVEVVGFDRTARGFGELDALVDLARSTLVGEGVGRGRLDLVAVDLEEMTELNETHMGHPGPTDVLSFPLDADEVIGGGPVGDGPTIDGTDLPEPQGNEFQLHLGDVILCPEVARGQAPDHTGSEEAELALLVVHGVLHVLGHDHAEPVGTERMQGRERIHLAALGHRHPTDAGAPRP